MGVLLIVIFVAFYVLYLHGKLECSLYPIFLGLCGMGISGGMLLEDFLQMFVKYMGN